jgi:hypothetical protein
MSYDPTPPENSAAPRRRRRNLRLLSVLAFALAAVALILAR